MKITFILIQYEEAIAGTHKKKTAKINVSMRTAAAAAAAEVAAAIMSSSMFIFVDVVVVVFK